jgi:hypothetical protein
VKILFRIVLLCFMFMLPSMAAHAAQTPTVPPLSGFHQPVSPCPVAAPDIVTMVGHFKGQVDDWTVVASTKRDEQNYIVGPGARLDVFDAQCNVVLSKAFPDALEVSFETLNLGGTAILHVVSVVEGADDVHYTHLLFDGGLTPLQPMRFTSDAASSFYIGPLGAGKGYGVVQSYWPFESFPTGKNQVTLVFHWRQETLESGMTMGWFAGPDIFEQRPSTWTQFGQNACDMGFPLLHYLFGRDGCG